MKHLRPWQVFAHIPETSLDERIVQIPLPAPRPGAGGVSLLETFLLIAAARIVNARNLFEFGTFLGRTTLNLGLNIPEDARIWTLDLNEDEARSARQDPGDACLTKVHLDSKSLDFQGTPAAKKIIQLFGNSTTFDFSSWKETIDLVFIDGGHDRATLDADTKSAMALVRRDDPSCIAWHDYGNPECPDVAPYLDAISDLDILHISDTRLCLWFNGGIKISEPPEEFVENRK